jgi:hypothetical protein
MDLISPQQARLKMKSRKFLIDPNDELLQALKDRLGEDKVVVEKIEL